MDSVDVSHVPSSQTNVAPLVEIIRGKVSFEEPKSKPISDKLRRIRKKYSCISSGGWSIPDDITIFGLVRRIWGSRDREEEEEYYFLNESMETCIKVGGVQDLTKRVLERGFARTPDRSFSKTRFPEDFWFSAPKKGIMVFALPGEPGLMELAGWYDVVVLPAQDCKWMFKEGDVAILSSPKPGTFRYKKSNNTGASEDDMESEVTGRVAGTVRRHIPTDTRDPLGATLHFFVGDIYDSNREVKNIQYTNLEALVVFAKEGGGDGRDALEVLSGGDGRRAAADDRIWRRRMCGGDRI
ncbi:hypothetical protein QJS10_CPA01g00853 [Acorus calamus]|uniref:PTEN2A/B C2 domain-containing protein n=1 Tax=Acorus calamus TaxID=4465 RepID=A0AAV9FJC1_ACOCL|nr:hypothetical protein QJS10_CPA01g00853 [Acorus calamus]